MNLAGKKISDTFDNLLCNGPKDSDTKITLGNGADVPWAENGIVVTNNTTQTIQGNKTFQSPLTFPATINFTSNGSLIKQGNHQVTLETSANSKIDFASSSALTYTIPNLTGNASFVMTEGNQTINGQKIFEDRVVIRGDTDVGLDTSGTNRFGVGAKTNIFGQKSSGWNEFGNDVTGNGAYNEFGQGSNQNRFGSYSNINAFGRYATGYNIFGGNLKGVGIYNSFGSNLESGAENRFGANSKNYFGEDGENYFYSGSFEGPVTLPSTVNYTSAGSIVKAGTHALGLTTVSGTTGTFPAGNITIAALEGQQTFAGEKTFSSGINITKTTNQLVLGSTNKTTITASTPSSARTYTIPDAGGNAEFVMTTGVQEIGSAKIFNRAIFKDSLTFRTGGDDFDIVVRMTGAGQDLMYTIPDVSGNADFLMTKGNQDIDGIKNFSERPQVNGVDVAIVGQGLATLAYGLKFGNGLSPQNRTYKGDQNLELSINTGVVLTTNNDQDINSNKTFLKQLKINSTNHQLVLGTGVDGSTMTVTTPLNISSNRIYTIPDVGGNGAFVIATGSQTIGGAKNFTTRPTFSGSGIALLDEIPTNIFTLDTVQTVSATKTFTNQQIFQRATNQISLRTGADGNSITLTAPTITSNRTYTLPDVSSSEFIMAAGNQTIGGTKTFSSTISGSIDGNAGSVTNGVYTTGTQTIAGQKTFTAGPVIQTGSNQLTLRTGSAGSKIDITAPTITANRTYTIPDVGVSTAQFVMTEGNQTISGAKEFRIRPTVSGYPVLISGDGVGGGTIDPTTLVYTNNDQTISATKTFTSAPVLQGSSNQLVLRTGAGGSAITLTAPTIGGNRTYTIPDAAGSATFVMTASSQTIGGTKTFTNQAVVQATSNQLVLRTGAGGFGSTISASQIGGNQVFTLPNLNTNADFVMNAGNQTIGGTKTFSSTIAGNINGNANTVTSGVYTYGTQNISGQKTFINSNMFLQSDLSASLVISRATQDANANLIQFRKYRGTHSNQSGVINGDNLGAIYFYGHDSGTIRTSAYIGVNVDGNVSSGVSSAGVTGQVPSRIVFGTENSLGQELERMRITSEGRVGINETSPLTTLHVNGAITAELASNQLVLRTGSAGNSVYITAPTIAANRTYTIPDAGSSAAFVLTAGDQTIGGIKTFTSAIKANDRIALGGDASNAVSFYNLKTIGGGATSYGNYTNANVTSTATTAAYGYRTSLSTEAVSFILPNLYHYAADQDPLGASSVVTNQFGFVAQSSLTGATNNYGFYGNINSAAGRWNFYADGTAANRFNGFVGLNVDPTFRLHLSSDSAAKPTSSTWTISSDERLKENIELADLDICYNAVKNIPLKRYTWKSEFYSDDQIKDRSKIGWIAQDVRNVFPKAVGTHKFIYNEVKNEEGEVISQESIDDCLSLNSDQIYATLYGAVQKLMKTVEDLQARIQQLENSSN